MKKTKFKNQKAITLIALVITIIVMLILAGVGIAMLTGENGVLTQATNAKDETIETGIKEEIELAYQSVLTQLYAEQIKQSEVLTKLSEELGVPVAENENNYSCTYKGFEIEISKEENKVTVNTHTQNLSNIKWIYTEVGNGNIMIEGMDLSDYELIPAEDGKSASISLNMDTLYIPSIIDNKKVISFYLYASIFPKDEIFVKINDVKKIVYGYSLESIIAGGENIIFEDLEEVILPQNLKCIDSLGFIATKLREIDIPEGTTKISSYAFGECKSLVKVNLPNTITEINETAFMQTENTVLNFYDGINENLVIPTNKWGAKKITEKGPIKFTIVPIGDDIIAEESSTFEINEIQTWAEWMIENKNTFERGNVGYELIELPGFSYIEAGNGKLMSGGNTSTIGTYWDFTNSKGITVHSDDIIRNGETYTLMIDSNGNPND